MLILAGLEPTGRAGLLADAEAVHAMRAHPIAIATALTAQGMKTFRSDPVEAKLISSQIRAALELGPIDSVKLGMIPSASQLDAIRRALRSVDAWWVVDPVVRSSKGEPLSELTEKHYLKLAGPKVVLTPNADEAAWLTGDRSTERTVDAAEAHARALVARGFGAVVVKGGHLDGRPVDVLVAGDRVRRFSSSRLERPVSIRGTGCRYASALASALASGLDLDESVRAANVFVRRHLRSSG